MRVSLLWTIILMVLSIFVYACSGGETGTGNTGDVSTNNDQNQKTTIGSISAFGSIFVNGIRFNTDNSQIIKNGVEVNETELAHGMVVTVIGSVDSNGLTGLAEIVKYDNKVGGVVLANDFHNGNINVMGQTISFDDNTVFESSVDGVESIEDITKFSFVEISGYLTGSGSFYATRIDVKNSTVSPDASLRVAGRIEMLSSDRIGLGGLELSYDQSTQLVDIPNGILRSGLSVLIIAHYVIDPLSGESVFQAQQIEMFEMRVDTDVYVELEGLITRDVDFNTLIVNSTRVIISDNTAVMDGQQEDLVSGLRLIVSGVTNSDGDIYADRIEILRPPEFSFFGMVELIDYEPPSVRLFNQTITLQSNTIIKDDGVESSFQKFSLADLSVNDLIKVQFKQDRSTGLYLATKLERKFPDGELKKIKGPILSVQGFGVNLSLTIGGVELNLGAPLNSNLSGMVVGTIVEASGAYDSTANIFYVDTLDVH